MTKEQYEHYFKGGKFKAIYNPTSLDIDGKSKSFIGKEIEVYQNCLISPILEERYKGQFRFNSPSIYGWFPEEDIQIISIIDDYVDFPEKINEYHLYKLTYLNQFKIDQNFGKTDIKVPYSAYREYSSNSDDYVINKLSNPKACIVEKSTWHPFKHEQTEWQIIYKEN